MKRERERLDFYLLLPHAIICTVKNVVAGFAVERDENDNSKRLRTHLPSWVLTINCRSLKRPNLNLL